MWGGLGTYVDTGRQATGINAVDWAQRLVDLGAGELLVTSIDHEGMRNGFETELIKRINDAVSIPVIACGGCGHPRHIDDLIAKTKVSAVACASIFHYNLFEVGAI